MLNHVIVFSNKSLRRIFTCLRLYKIRYSMLENKKNPVFIGVGEGFEFKTGIYAWFTGPTYETPAEVNFAKKIGFLLTSLEVSGILL